MNSTPAIAGMSRMSSASTRPLSSPRRSRSEARSTCDQPPGAAPRSTTTMPGRNSLPRSTSSSSLYAARERMPSACAFFTKGSEKCSFNQRWLLLLRVAMGREKPVDSGPHDTLPYPLLPLPVVMSSPLSNAQKRYLRGLAHDLKPVVMIGAKGVGPSLLAELDQALEMHELLKVKVAAEDREQRDALIESLLEPSQ